MESKGLIKREIDDNDRRYIKITLTETSKALEYSANKVIDNVNALALKDFTLGKISLPAVSLSQNWPPATFLPAEPVFDVVSGM